MAGYRHSFLKGKCKDGEDKLYASGNNKFGQLALSDNQDRVQWTKVIIPSEFKLEKVIAGGFHTFLKVTVGGEDKLYACGKNWEGQLGLGDTTNRAEWTKVPVPQGFSVEKVRTDYMHTFLKGKGKDGEDNLYACGRNWEGQLGLGNTNNRSRWTKVPFPKDFSIEKVIAGGYHSFLKGKGKDGEDKLYACGNNYNGQLGLGNTTDRGQWTEVPIADLLKKSQENVNDLKQDADVSEASGSSSFSMGLNPRDCIF